ncbi:hypothetical protein NDU88_005625 [Pleurodeles waltl]|uniref:Uncharacterized protein n=1 Tax=Pleurodeles waltl TaxID=8319 RepID=A0AAV7TCS4_PLEWA|nr:hypothetical protein NDU88_005625 [Pleurodeles waltl]
MTPSSPLTVRTSNLVQNPTSGEDTASSLLEKARPPWPSTQPPGRLHSLVKHPGGSRERVSQGLLRGGSASPRSFPAAARRCASELPTPDILAKRGGTPRAEPRQNMGLTPSRGGSLPAPRTHLSSRFQGRDQPGAADKMAAAAFCSGPLRGSTSARPPERTWSRQQVESGRRSRSRRRDVAAAPQERPANFSVASPRGALNQASFPVAILAPTFECYSYSVSADAII